MDGCYPTFSSYIAKLEYMPALMYRYLLTMVVVWRLYTWVAIVWRKSGGSRTNHYAVRA